MTELTRSVLRGMLALGLTVGVTSAPAANTAGTLDPTFGTNGLAIASVASGVGIVDSMVLQGDGKILVLVLAGSNNVVFRFTANGALDTSFGSNGTAVLSPPVGGSMTLQANGQILIAGVVTNPSTGVAELGLERLNTDGTPDTFFGSGGLATASLNNRAPGAGFCLLAQPNGDILMGTQLFPVGRRAPTQTILARFISTGATDTTFGSNGTEIVTAPSGCTAVALLSTGEFLVVDSESIAQFTANGTPEATVTGGSVVATNGSNQNGVANVFQANGDYLFLQEMFVGEESRGHNAFAQVFRFTDTGAVDPTFANPGFHFSGSGGSGIEAIPNSMALQSNGDIVVVGQQTTFSQSGTVTVNGLARLTSSGALDSTFGNGGTEVNSIPTGTLGLDAVAIQPSGGNIITAGIANGNLVVSRYLSQ